LTLEHHDKNVKDGAVDQQREPKSREEDDKKKTGILKMIEKDKK
jgi:hypothetical protein